jgi:hypothetical protein
MSASSNQLVALRARKGRILTRLAGNIIKREREQLNADLSLIEDDIAESEESKTNNSTDFAPELRGQSMKS